MAIKGKGDEEVARLRGAISEAGIENLRRRLCAAAAGAALTEVQLGFKASKDPHGQPWEALKYRDGMPLRKTGTLANSFSSRPIPKGFQVGTNVIYAGPHQRGDTVRPRKAKALRFFVPLRGPVQKIKGQKRVPLGMVAIFAGAVKLPKREMVPFPKLSDQWIQAIDEAQTEAATNFFKRFGPV